MKLIFAGTPAFAATALNALVHAGHDIALVLTQPDRPSGRGMKLQESAVALAAHSHQLRVEKFATLKTAESQAVLQAIAPDMMVVAAYGLLLPQAVLDIPKLGCVNIHGSLLPRWRGAAPVQRAIEAGDAQTGVDIMVMEAGLDTGPVLLEKRINILPTHTAGSLMNDLATLGAQAMVEAIASWPTLKPAAQDHAQATYAKKIEKAEARIDWQHDAAQIERRLRAFDPFPGGLASWSGHDCAVELKVWRAEVLPNGKSAPLGAIVQVNSIGVDVACGPDGQQRVRLTELQAPGAKRGAAALVAQAAGLAAGMLPRVSTAEPTNKSSHTT
jgi:methionyl-tRNA formyltransferase